jgi:hypothetical protein
VRRETRFGSQETESALVAGCPHWDGGAPLSRQPFAGSGGPFRILSQV